jgi:hypothetical protein
MSEKNYPLENQCPFCSYKTDNATKSSQDQPEHHPVEGDFSICLKCGRVARFDPTLKLIPFNMGDLVHEDPYTMRKVLEGVAAWRFRQQLIKRGVF